MLSSRECANLTTYLNVYANIFLTEFRIQVILHHFVELKLAITSIVKWFDQHVNKSDNFRVERVLLRWNEILQFININSENNSIPDIEPQHRCS